MNLKLCLFKKKEIVKNPHGKQTYFDVIIFKKWKRYYLVINDSYKDNRVHAAENIDLCCRHAKRSYLKSVEDEWINIYLSHPKNFSNISQHAVLDKINFTIPGVYRNLKLEFIEDGDLKRSIIKSINRVLSENILVNELM